jgi:hypothetical protein
LFRSRVQTVALICLMIRRSARSRQFGRLHF